MIVVIGTYNKSCGSYTLYAPDVPYKRITYIGYTWKEIQKRYRDEYGLKRKHIKWKIY